MIQRTVKEFWQKVNVSEIEFANLPAVCYLKNNENLQELKLGLHRLFNAGTLELSLIALSQEQEEELKALFINIVEKPNFVKLHLSLFTKNALIAFIQRLRNIYQNPNYLNIQFYDDTKSNA